MVHRDPETGLFVSDDDMSRFDDIEMATFNAGVGVEATNVTGATGFSSSDVFTFSGVEVIDYDEFVDRNEELHLLSAHHTLVVYANSTETEDGTVAATVSVSADPARTSVDGVINSTSTIEGDVVGNAETDDSIDYIGRSLQAVAHAPFSDTADGKGGGGSAGKDEIMATEFPAEAGRFHPRDELFLNGTLKVWNIDDAGIHAALNGQHVYGVIED